MRILVVEDEPRIQEYLKKGLEMKAWTVDVASDGETGLDLALTENYSVIILDWMLPKLAGDQVCQQLRLAKIHTPILMLTAKNEISDRVTGLDCGADDYLGKPFDFAELLARVRALSRRPQQAITTKLTINGISLDPIGFKVKRANQLINLSKTEFILLEFLMRHAGQVLSKDQITQQVWSYESDVLPNTAQVYIGYLRKKIDLAFPKLSPVIRTIRGFGYQFGNDQSEEIK